jgi:uncharacterized membrane protein YjfL (UPF0719 family)
MDPNFLQHFISFWVYGISSIVMVLMGFKVFDWFTPGIHFVTELVEKQNRAVAMVVSAFILAVAAIAVAVVAS